MQVFISTFPEAISLAKSGMHKPFFHKHIPVHTLDRLIQNIKFYLPNIPMFSEPCYLVTYDGTLYIFQRGCMGLTLLFSDVLAEISLDHSIEVILEMVVAVGEFTKSSVCTLPLWVSNSDLGEPVQNSLSQTVPFVDLKHPTFDSYLSSMPKKGRYKVKTALKQLETYGTEVTIHTQLPTNLRDWVVATTQSRWVSDEDDPDFVYEVALLQWILAFTLENAFFVQLSQQGDTIAVGCFVLADTFWSFNSFCQSEFLDGIGVQTLAIGVRHMIENPVHGVTEFSPTATFLPWQPAFHLYKHSVGNTHKTAYMCYAAMDTEDPTPPYYDIRQHNWVAE